MRVQGELVIGRPVEDVFDFAADERNEPRYNRRMVRAEKLTPGPIGVGTRFRADMKAIPRPTEMTTELTGFERPRSLTLTTRLSWMDIEGRLTFDPVPEGTRMRWQWELHPHGLLRLAGPLIGSMGRRQEQVIWTNLKRLLEAQDDAASEASERVGRAG